MTGRRRLSAGLGALAVLSICPLLAAGSGDSSRTSFVAGSRLTTAALERWVDSRGSDPEEIFKLQCVPCHGVRGEGDGPAAVAFNPRPADLTDPELMSARTDADLRAVLERGKGSMPAFGPILASEDLDSLVTYVRKLSGG